MHKGAYQFVQAVSDFIFVQEEPCKADLIFVPGNASPEHALLAAKLYHQGYAPLILPSGKHSLADERFMGVASAWRSTYPDQYETEWHFLRDVMLREGVPNEAILREDEATFTWDNAVKSRAVTDRLGIRVRRGILCCRSFHARRALLYYQTAYPETKFRVCAASVPGLNRDDWFESEEGRDTVFGELKLLGSQVRKEFETLMQQEPFQKR